MTGHVVDAVTNGGALSPADPAGGLDLRGAKLLSRLEDLLGRTSQASPSVGVVLVAWDEDRAAAALEDIDSWLALEPGSRRAVAVCNRAMDLHVGPLWERVHGSNDAGEFSGFDEGVLALTEFAPDVWVLLNDRYAAYGGSPLGLFDAAFLRVASSVPVVLGQRDALDRRVMAGRAALPAYIRTHYLVISDESLRRLGSLATFQLEQADDLLPPGWPLRPGAGTPVGDLDAEYLDFLSAWLTGKHEVLPSVWYRATTDPSRLQELRLKAVSIVNEHSLAARADDAGLVVVDRLVAHRSRGMQRHMASLEGEVRRWDVFQPSQDARGYRVKALVRTLLAVGQGRGRRAPRWRHHV